MLQPEDYWDLDGTYKKLKGKKSFADRYCWVCAIIVLGSCIIFWDKFQLWPCLFFAIGIGFAQAGDESSETDIDLSILSGKIRARNREWEEKGRKENVDNQ